MRYKAVKCDICGLEIREKKGMITAKKVGFNIGIYRWEQWKDCFDNVDICPECVKVIAELRRKKKRMDDHD